MTAQKPWHKFIYDDIKFNKRCIQRYLRVDKDLFDYSEDYNELPDVYDATDTKAPKKRKISFLASNGESDSPVKRSFQVRDSSTDEEVVEEVVKEVVEEVGEEVVQL